MARRRQNWLRRAKNQCARNESTAPPPLPPPPSRALPQLPQRPQRRGSSVTGHMSLSDLSEDWAVVVVDGVAKTVTEQV